MQNSLERIFEGVENTLRTIVAPTITDPYILSQVTSVAEIIGNLSTRVEWSPAQLREVVTRVRPVLDLAAGSGIDDLPRTAEVLSRPVPPPDAPSTDLLAARDASLFALREVHRRLERHPDDALDAAVRDFLAWQVASESALLRSGMFSAPKPPLPSNTEERS